MEELQKLFKVLSEAWDKFVVSFRKLAKSLETILGKRESLTRVKRKGYGQTQRKNMCCQKCKKYDYIPVIRRNLPYQRRNF